MHIPREIRRKLESSLPSHVLDFLTEKFIESEQYCEKAKQLEKENNWLHQQLHQTLTGIVQGQKGLGYSQHSDYGTEIPSARYLPYEEEDYPRYYMRRGVPGTGRRMTADQGGGQGGGQGGSSAKYDEYVPEIERPYRRHIPVHREEPPLQPST